MDSAAFFKKKNGRYRVKYFGSDSFYKNGLLLECILFFRHLMKGKLLDLGCGSKPYFEIYSEVCESSVGCDVPFSLHQISGAEVFCLAEDIDKHFEPEFFDCVLCTEVLEHTLDDNKVMNNINMVLKTGGSLIISAPFTYVLHEAPYDYRRYTLYGLKNILERNNFEVKSAFSAGASLSSGFFIFYYTLKKILFYSFKKIGAANLYNNKFINAFINLPELLLYLFNIHSFRNKLKENKSPSMNEMFSSPGYFIIAKKIKSL